MTYEPGTTHDLNETMQKEVEFMRIGDFFSKTRSVYLGITFNILVTSQLIAPYTTLKSIGLWVLATAIFYMPRIVVTLRFFKAKKSQQLTTDNIGQWEKRIYLHSFLPFFAFSSIAFMPFAGDVFSGVAITALAIVALLSGGVIIYSSSIKVVTLYLYVSLGCLIARCLYESNYQFYILALYFLIMTLILRQLIKTQYRNYIDHLITQLNFEKDSLTDSLTGIANRRHLEIYLKDIIPVSHRTKSKLQIVMMDIDNFKKYNDTHGHLKGDELLISMTKLVTRHIRSSDFFARYGGEEFALILTANSREAALEFLNNLMKDIELTLDITISAGLSSSDMSDSYTQLIDLADQALYQSKQQGRNQISVAQYQEHEGKVANQAI